MRRSILPLLGAVATSLALVAGSAAPSVAAEPMLDAAGQTTVVIDPDLYAFLGEAGVAVAPIAPATAAPFEDTVAAAFPITKISTDGTRIVHEGGLELSTDDVDIAVENLVIRLAVERVTAEVSGSEIGDAGRVVMFRIKPTDEPDLGAVKLLLTTKAAGALNATFGEGIFSAGDTFGYATPEPEAVS